MFWIKNIFLTFFFVFSPFGVWSDPATDLSLKNLEKNLRSELIKLNIPPRPWVKKVHIEGCDDVLDVAIIGGGMAGQTVAFALMKEGITNIKIFDENRKGREGPWEKYARMKNLRSGKALTGPALGIPSLTCRSWYEAIYGSAAWKQLDTVPTKVWNEYLHWYGSVLKIPSQNQSRLKSIIPKDEGLELEFISENGKSIIYARKIVLATGRGGFGGEEIPPFLEVLSKNFYAHTNEEIDKNRVYNKNICIIGAGASAFDAAEFALENGANQVDLIIRRAKIPCVNKFSLFSFPGMLHGFHSLSDETRVNLFKEAFACGIPPTQESMNRVKEDNRLIFHFNTTVNKVEISDNEVILNTSKETLKADFIIAATGFAVDGWRRLELHSHMSFIQLWDEKILHSCSETQRLRNFPYLGSHFQFLEKEKGIAPYLKSIYCFNYGAYLSHGLMTGDIPGISFGASRLAKGIASDFFNEDFDYYRVFFESLGSDQ